MNINVQLEAQLREAAGVQQETVQIADGSSVVDAVSALARQHADAIGNRLLAESDELQKGLLIFVNDQPIAAAAAATRLLSDGDTVLLCPPISGG